MADQAVLALIDAALAEDVGAGDWTTEWTVPPDARARARVIARAPGVVAGVLVTAAVFRRLDPDLDIAVHRRDGDAVQPGEPILAMTGRARSILTAERTALNFLQHLSGVATLTRRYVDSVAGTGAAILDTRKTTPGWRALEKAAVVAGGGRNHRRGLHDMVLLKENHMAMAGGVAAAMDAVRALNSGGIPVEVEVRTLAELDEALDAGANRILLDNMDVDLVREAVRRARARPGVLLEASGGMTPERARFMATAGAHTISVGGLTHSAPALDVSLLLEPV
jgi:nicotinate-nucleotide pyrophosphorylase (carboxylating)